MVPVGAGAAIYLQNAGRRNGDGLLLYRRTRYSRSNTSLRDSGFFQSPTFPRSPNFPDLFMIYGPNGPLLNPQLAIETQVEIISDRIAIAERDPARLARAVDTTGEANSINGGGHRNGQASGPLPSHGIIEAKVEAKVEAEEDWTGLCDQLGSKSLFRRI
ncbi:hypothetical protein B0J13DRAFT_664062 [Dactylonectria estremocensis]|uniref:Uncharacterized protein n=1 Tax=Dactylonectria estremocensis TaxID=1079267 RepID=A0A9P9ETE2_9HYPO|nr:hypothetical protein B0J13DRAFT_664062 [Dactylonectria estremocensis]